MLNLFYHTTNRSCYVIILTAVFGGSDTLHKPEFDYSNISSCFHAYSDVYIKKDPWNVHFVNITAPPALLSRIPKIQSRQWINNSYILWIDAKHSLQMHPIKFVNMIRHKQILLLKQFSRNTLYDEYNWIYKHHCYSGRINCSILDEQYIKYSKYKDSIAYEASVFMINQSNSYFMNDWYNNYTSYFPRDQLALNYVLAVNNVKIQQLDRSMHYLQMHKHVVTKRYDHIHGPFAHCRHIIHKQGLFPFWISPTLACADAFSLIGLNIPIVSILLVCMAMLLTVHFLHYYI